MKSLIFSDEEIIKSSKYNDAVNPDVFLEKIRDLTEYEQDYSYSKAVDLKQAEKILFMIKAMMDK